MRWMRVTVADAFARAMADRHYPREKVGARMFTPPGWKVVLRLPTFDAYWVSLRQDPQYVDHSWAGAWVCSAFRNESPHLSSALIIEAAAATVDAWGPPPPLGMITFVDAGATERRRSKRALPGHCFRVAGFREEERRTQRGLICLRLPPEAFPGAKTALQRQGTLFPASEGP